MNQKKYKLPKIGLRIIKSAVGVFLCYVVNLLRSGQSIVHGRNHKYFFKVQGKLQISFEIKDYLIYNQIVRKNA